MKRADAIEVVILDDNVRFLYKIKTFVFIGTSKSRVSTSNVSYESIDGTLEW